MSIKRRTISLLLVLLGFLLIFTIATSFAESVRCSDSRLVSSGDTMKYVLDHCGPPAERYDLYNAFNQLIGVALVYNVGQGQSVFKFYTNGTMSMYGK
jgi:hypothetical protein